MEQIEFRGHIYDVLHRLKGYPTSKLSIHAPEHLSVVSAHREGDDKTVYVLVVFDLTWEALAMERATGSLDKYIVPDEPQTVASTSPRKWIKNNS